MKEAPTGTSRSTTPTNGDQPPAWPLELSASITSNPLEDTTASFDHLATLEQTQTLTEAWSLLKEQQDEFERRSQQLQILRDKLARHLEQQNHALLNRQRELDTHQLQAERERGYLQNAKLHLRRMMKEQSEQLQELHRRRHELSEYETRLDLTTPPPDDQVADEYQQQIAHLTQERDLAQQRITELQQQISQWSETTSALRPAAVHRSTDWRFGVALVMGLLAGVLLTVLTDFQYLASMTLTADSQQVSTEQLEIHRLALAQALAVAREKNPHPSRLNVLTLAAQPQSHTLLIEAQTTQPPQARTQLHEVAQEYLDELTRQREQAVAALGTEEQQLTSEITRLQQEYELVLTRLSNETLAIDIENPREELHRLYSGITTARRRFNQLREDLATAQTQLAKLQQTEIPDLPPVSDELRQTAFEQDEYLIQDREALRVRLNQLRQHLLQVFADSPETLRQLQGAVNELSGFVETQKLNLDDRRILTELEDFSSRAQDLAQLAADFEKRWTQFHENLREMSVDPGRRDTLDLHNGLEELTKNFNDDLNQQLEALQKQYQSFSQSLNNPAENFQLLTGLVKAVKNIVEAQMAFAGVAKRVIPRSDFQLDAIIHSAVGFTRRIQTRQTDLEVQLAQGLRQEMLNQLSNQIREQQLQIDQLAQSRDSQLDELLDLQDQLHHLVPYISEYGATEDLIRQSPAQAEQLLTKIEELKQQQQQRVTQADLLRQTPPPLNITAVEVASWPMDTSARLIQNTFAGCCVAGIVYLLLIMLRRLAHRTPRPAAVGILPTE
ncbi:MAG: hypothetical protein HJJLKODD_00172 [Phycisphaerae bacterium]|nr:hypothetical protein [Phycisphaerae bacterium]